MRAKLRASAAVLAAAGFFTALSATEAAADPNSTREFSVSGASGGHSGYSNGYLYFYNRSVGITGSVKSDTTGCVQVVFQVYSHGEETDFQTRTACGRGTGSSTGFNFTSPANYSGGASEVRVTLAGINSLGQSHWLDARSYYP
jgi:hypothetical protein